MATSFFSGLRKFFGGGGSSLPSSLSQRTIDAYRSSLLLSSFALVRGKEQGSQPTQAEVDKIMKRVQEWPIETMTSFSQIEINKQVLAIFAALEVHRKQVRDTSKFSSTTTISSSGRKPSPPPSSSASSYVDTVGFELERRKSHVPGAGVGGQGVFIRIPASLPQLLPAGTVLGLFAGQVHLSEYTQSQGYVQEHLLPDPEMLSIVRVDEPIVIDGRTAHLCNPNPYALAHLVNHCGSSPPNVLQYPFDFSGDPLDLDPNAFPKALRRFIPNNYARKPTLLGTTDRSAFMHGQVLLAARPLESGDELLMDYRLRPSSNLPPWYKHYDHEQAEQRWKQT